MKKWKVVVVAVILAILAGCQSAPEAGYYEKLTAVVNESVDAQQESTREIVEAIKVSALVDEDSLAKIENQLDKVDVYVDTAQEAAKEAARVYEEKRSESKIIAAIEGARAANVVSTPVNPYAPLIEAVLGVAAVVAGGFAYKKQKDLTLVGKKYKAHKRGVERILCEDDVVKADVIYEVISEERKKLGI